MNSTKLLALMLMASAAAAGSLEGQATDRGQPSPSAPAVTAAAPAFLPRVAKGMTSGKQGAQIRKARLRELARLRAERQRQQRAGTPRG